MSRDQFVVFVVCAGFMAWALLPAAVRAVRAWYRPEPLAPYRHPGGDRR